MLQTNCMLDVDKKDRSTVKFHVKSLLHMSSLFSSFMKS